MVAAVASAALAIWAVLEIAWGVNPFRRGLGYVVHVRWLCTTAKDGRVVTVGPHEAHLAAARGRQREASWRDAYRATRPKVERKLAHLMRDRHGGRRARVRRRRRVAQDFGWLSAATNLARLAVLGVAPTATGGWEIAC